MAKRITRIIGLVLAILSFGVGVFLIYEIFAPEIEDRIDKPDVEETIQIIQSETKLNQNRLYIPSIGVDMEVGNNKQFLNFGGWVQEVDYEGMPELIAIHRFGFNSLTAEEKVKQTLYHVNKLDEGDVVYLVWEGVLYEYGVKEVVSGVNNPEVQKELIIYTCRFISSKERVFIVLSIEN